MTRSIVGRSLCGKMLMKAPARMLLARTLGHLAMHHFEKSLRERTKTRLLMTRPLARAKAMKRETHWCRVEREEH